MPGFESIAPARGGGLRACLALALLAFAIYNANLRLVTSGDNFPARYLPFAILGHGTLYLDPVEKAVSQGRAQPYWMVPGRNGHVVSQYPVVTPALVAPLYLPAVAYLDARGWTDERLERLARLMEKISATIIASLSVAVVYLLLRRRTDPRTATLMAVAYAFGTNTWMIGSQGLWQHGMGELLLAVALLLVTGQYGAARAFAVGTVCALAAFNRPPDALLAAAIGLYALRWAGRGFALVVAGAVGPSALLLAYNIGAVGYLAGGYAIAENAEFFRFSLPLGVAGLLFSLGRGLFVFTPFLLALALVPWGWKRGERAGGLAIMVCMAVVLQLLFYAKIDWRGGSAWGPRYLTDMLPLLVWLVAPAVAGLGRAGRVVFCAAVAVSIAIQAVGAFWYTGKSDEAMNVSGPDHMRSMWNLKSTPFIAELRHPAAYRDLFARVGGAIETVTGAEIPAGAPLTVTGWTLTDDHLPSNVVVNLYAVHGTWLTGDEQPPFQVIRTFDPRGGWTATLQTAGLPPGEYAIQVTAQGGEGGEYLPVELRPLKLLPAEREQKSPQD
ncbi:MAG TPA: hypothetical protein VG733_04165 [Chthoniobacteraceae bacterium]|nr:hypothetical protein [Chthoniobacteraceae bacterium]